MDILFLSFAEDFDLVLKIFFILFAISFIKQRVTNNTVSIFLISIAIIVCVFMFWDFIKIPYILYTLLTIGVASVLVDFFFISGHAEAEKQMKQQEKMEASMKRRERDELEHMNVNIPDEPPSHITSHNAHHIAHTPAKQVTPQKMKGSPNLLRPGR